MFIKLISAIKEKFPLNFENMTLLPSGELLVSIKKKYLKVLSNTTKNLEKSKYSVAPLKTTVALHVTNFGRSTSPKRFIIII
jgi:hypothetical protein